MADDGEMVPDPKGKYQRFHETLPLPSPIDPFSKLPWLKTLV
jgi:hypothetical protein